MLRLSMTLLCLTLFTCQTSGQDNPTDAKRTELKTTAQQASYGIGIIIGRRWKGDGLEVDIEVFAQGLKDVFQKEKPRLTEAQISAAIDAFQTEMAAKLVEKNKAEGKAFLAANRKKEGVVTLESGLQYKVLKKGEGASPKITDTVRTHYHGTLIDGTIFDSSVERDKPAEFAVGGVIRGWTEALQLMKVGSKWRLFVPSELAYGPRGTGQDIGPHAVLIFDVELLEIK